MMPGMTLVGSSPTFYKIPVTKELAQAVAQGQFPATPTVVYVHLPAMPRPARRLSEGMKPLDNRRHTILRRSSNLRIGKYFTISLCWIKTNDGFPDIGGRNMC